MGRLNLYNVLAAVSAAVALDIPEEAISSGIGAVTHVDGRLQRVAVPESFGVQVIVDYAHTPDAMDKALALPSRNDFEAAHCGLRLRRRPRPGKTPDHGKDCRAAG